MFEKRRFGTGCKGYRSFALTAPSNRNPQGVTLPRYLRLIAAGAVEASLSSLTTFAVRNPRGATCSCTTRDLLLQNSSITKLCFVIPTERSDEESILLITRFLTSVRNDKYAIIFAFSFNKELYLFCRLCRSLTSILCCIF